MANIHAHISANSKYIDDEQYNQAAQRLLRKIDPLPALKLWLAQKDFAQVRVCLNSLLRAVWLPARREAKCPRCFRMK